MIANGIDGENICARPIFVNILLYSRYIEDCIGDEDSIGGEAVL